VQLLWKTGGVVGSFKTITKYTLFLHPLKRHDMKKLFFLLLCAFSLAVSCNKDDDDTPNDPDIPLELPPATQHGANTLGFLIDGKPWVAEIDSRVIVTSFFDIDCKFDEPGEGTSDISYFSISCHRLLYTESSTSFVYTDSIRDIFSIRLTPIYSAGEVVFDDLSRKDITFVTGGTNSQYYEIDTLYNNYINFTTLDTIRNICSGIFDVRLIREFNMDTINITEGRFDVKYQPD
jgi:hypothetical protein